ncbi:spore germination protein [Lachnospiraceae bacterium OttesenSCG-928-D06]|nr:spore germination protein [Lachnospiraceae bacterium OttesenSCG-928-D06]
MDLYHNEKHIITEPLKKELDENIKLFEDILKNCDDIIKYRFQLGKVNKTEIYMAYADNMIDRGILQDNTIENFLFRMNDLPPTDKFDYIKNHSLQSADVKTLLTMDEVTQSAISGDVIIFVEGYDKAIMLSLKSFPNRGVPTVETEVTVRGAKDSFTEVVAFNKVLIRRRIKDTNLKMENLTVGIRSRTSVTLSYIEGIARPEIIEEVKKRLDSFTIDGVFDIGMVESLIESKWYSLFPQFQSTERPDKTASALLEGRVVLLVDNSPMALVLPVTFHSFFQAADDYYNRFSVASFFL